MYFSKFMYCILSVSSGLGLGVLFSTLTLVIVIFVHEYFKPRGIYPLTNYSDIDEVSVFYYSLLFSTVFFTILIAIYLYHL